MTFLRRLAVVVSLVMTGLLAFSVTTVAFDLGAGRGVPLGAQGGGGGGGGSFLPAGNYHDTSVNAGFFDFSDPSIQMTVSVSDNTNIANPLVGPSTSNHEVDVFFNACNFGKGGLCGGGCFVPDGASDFTVSSNLSSAVLKTTVTATTASCQNNPVSGFTFPFSLTINWSGGASSGAFTNNGRYSCAGYMSQTMTTTASGSNIVATASASFLDAPLGPIDANINSFDQRIHAEGAAPDSCVPLGGGKGAGIGPQPPGDYHFVSQFASTPVIPDDPFASPYNIDASSFTNVFHPNGGPATIQVETDLHIFQFNGFNFIRACYVLPASAFTFSSQSATLHASIVPSTPMCEGTTNDGLPPSFTIDITWTATGPTATFRFTTSIGCGGGAHFGSSGVQTTAGANASGTISGIATSFQSPQASLNTNDVSFHIAGKSC
ncbi:MAG: hypothetical protein E6I36_10615 [Chloroflexi bacterium]|nr:MAG: hypothetical protein E6I36_10615 [Chloroflexota bacterium]